MRLSVAAGLLALMLAGCAATLQPMGPPVTAPRLDSDGLVSDALITADGVRLPLRHWLPAKPPRAVILALHGFNDYSRSFAWPGAYFAAHGIASYAYDQRGFGNAPRPGIWPGTATLVGDLRCAAALLHERYPGVPLFVLGESMGGAVVTLALTSPTPADQPALDVAGAVLVSPALWGRAVMNPFYRFTLWLGSNTVPGLTVTAPRGLEIWPSDNIEMLRALSRDPLVIKETRIDAISGLVDLMSDALEQEPRVTTPSLVLYGEHEQVLPPGAVDAAIARLGPAAQLKRYRDGYHMLLRDRGRLVVWRDIVAWIESRIPPAARAAGS
ncbi:MAG: lysophospholipase [Azospirillaceae bacterium]|nr:lysophospholipase [Azospirillaceae bacterium]